MCTFCKIINKEIPSDSVFEDEDFIAIKTINPQAPTHFLIIPKKHIESIAYLEDNDRDLMGSLILCARDIGKKLNMPGYRLQLNVGVEGGQEIMHIHLHLLGNKTKNEN